MLMILAALIAALFAPPAAETPECEAIHALIGGELVAWDSASYSWPDLPDDLERRPRIDFESGGIWERYSPSQQARYLWVFTSYERNADANGQHFGAHNFCGPYRITDD
jgi:hypothetical protein